MYARGMLVGVTTALLAAAMMATGCAKRQPVLQTAAARENDGACGSKECHAEQVLTAGTGQHASLKCVACHEGTGDAHAKNPETAKSPIKWEIGACGGCHEAEAATYLYDDNARIGPFGGSIRVPEQPKAKTFPEYKTIVAGHAFTRDYNEEGAHAYMLEDHYNIQRGKFETCVQCKSTKVAYYWDSGKAITVDKDAEVTLTHTATGTIPAKKVSIPKGTKLTLATDPKTRVVDAKAVLPDGTTYTSQPKPSDDATANFNMLWATTIAATKDVMPYGQSCNHCHDPHSGEARIVRKAMQAAIAGEGAWNGSGVNPYRKGSAKSFEKASEQDKRTLVCAQCHVEYTCGKSGVDGKDRDVFGWGKARDLHATYSAKFDYKQDWKNALIGEPLIKSQHPETELYWESTHYNTGASCADCHMPDIRIAGKTIRSHWMTSPYKYSNAEAMKKFSAAVGADLDKPTNPCQRCHGDRTQRGIEQQQTVFKRQQIVQKLLAESVRGLAKMKASGATSTTAEFAEALDNHRQAHVLWENLIVSENSMGFHNFDEVMESMGAAEKNVRAAIVIEKAWAAKKK